MNRYDFQSWQRQERFCKSCLGSADVHPKDCVNEGRCHVTNDDRVLYNGLAAFGKSMEEISLSMIATKEAANQLGLYIAFTQQRSK